MASISFPNLLPTYFVKETLFSFASPVEKPLQLDMTTISKPRPSCVRINVQVDLISDLPKFVQIMLKYNTIICRTIVGSVISRVIV